MYNASRILVKVTIYHRLRIGRDGNLKHLKLRYIVTCTRTGPGVRNYPLKRNWKKTIII